MAHPLPFGRGRRPAGYPPVGLALRGGLRPHSGRLARAAPSPGRGRFANAPPCARFLHCAPVVLEPHPRHDFKQIYRLTALPCTWPLLLHCVQLLLWTSGPDPALSHGITSRGAHTRRVGVRGCPRPFGNHRQGFHPLEPNKRIASSEPQWNGLLTKPACEGEASSTQDPRAKAVRLRYSKQPLVAISM